MIEIHTIDDLALIKESVDLECKLATGPDGKGELPKDFWPTYSAFANSEGGLVVLGVREKTRCSQPLEFKMLAKCAENFSTV